MALRRAGVHVSDRHGSLPNAAQAPRDRATVAQLSEFDEIIDVRTPSEFALDHVPGARNLPVLSDDERARVGTLYKQVSALQRQKARRGAGFAPTSRRHLEIELQDKPRSWRPLVYCWRGGQRSARVHPYPARDRMGREAARGRLQVLPACRDRRSAGPRASRFRWRVVCGLTGSGKSRLLGYLNEAGAQVLDLEHLAAHRGSVLGDLPDSPQPTQKMFESLVWNELRASTRSAPSTWSRRARGSARCKCRRRCWTACGEANVCSWRASTATRVALLKPEYAHFLRDPRSAVFGSSTVWCSCMGTPRSIAGSRWHRRGTGTTWSKNCW